MTTILPLITQSSSKGALTPTKKVVVSKLQLKIFQSLCEGCPPGKVCTYLSLAKSIGRPTGARMASKLMSTNPFSPYVPCHRVVGSNRKLLGYFGTSVAEALLFRQALLEEEGVTCNSSISTPPSSSSPSPSSSSSSSSKSTNNQPARTLIPVISPPSSRKLSAKHPEVPEKYVLREMPEFSGDLKTFISFLESHGCKCINPTKITSYDDDGMQKFTFLIPSNPLANHPKNTLRLGYDQELDNVQLADSICADKTTDVIPPVPLDQSTDCSTDNEKKTLLTTSSKNSWLSQNTDT